MAKAKIFGKNPLAGFCSGSRFPGGGEKRAIKASYDGAAPFSLLPPLFPPSLFPDTFKIPRNT